jgi:hypothetical protein
MLRDKAAVDSFTGRTRPTPLPPRQRLLLLDAGRAVATGKPAEVLTWWRIPIAIVRWC